MPTSTTELPERLRLETRDLHRRSEGSGVMAELLAQRLGLKPYLALLRNLHAIYEALESALRERRSEPVLALLDAAPLRRAGVLASDLDELQGPGWHAWPLAPATRGYVERLQALALGDARPLVAHAYVRYLGDLHGGQVLKRLVAGGLGLTKATRFYDFGDEAQVLVLRRAFRRALAQVHVAPAVADAIVAEARWAFEEHIRLFEELTETASASD